MAVSGGAGGAGAPAAAERPEVSPWLIAVLVALAAFMEVLDTTIANVALPYIAGGMGVSEDEASWVVTTYLVANAVILTASPYLARRFSRKAFFLACLALFTVSSVLCGFAANLQELLLFRILQGLGGGGMVPVAQSILASAFPPEKRGQGFALFGVAVVVAPVIGPTLGGWMSDNVSWHWCFLINGPVGAITIALIAAILREPDSTEARKASGWRARPAGSICRFRARRDLSRHAGSRARPRARRRLVRLIVHNDNRGVSAVAFLLMIPWEMSSRNPAVDVRMVATRQFGACMLVMLATGGILLATTQFLPQIAQEEYGYTATLAGLMLSPGGVVTMAMMFVVGALSARVQPKYLIMVGALIVAASMYVLTNVYADLDFWYFARARMLTGLGLPLIFIPILSASYHGIAPEKTDQASAMMNAARNTGGSIGISIANNVLAHREQFHQSRLIEHASPSSVGYQSTLQQATHYFTAYGASPSQAPQQAVAWIGQQVQTQAAFLAYIDTFWVLMLIALAAAPLALTLSKVKLGGAAPMGH